MQKTIAGIMREPRITTVDGMRRKSVQIMTGIKNSNFAAGVKTFPEHPNTLQCPYSCQQLE